MFRDELRKWSAENPPAPLAVPTPELPKWDGQVFVRRVSQDVIAAYWAKVEKDPDTNPTACFAGLIACDATGNRLFSDDDTLWLSQSPALGPILDRIATAGRWYNGMTEENRMAWRKNLPSAAQGGSPSSLPAASTPATAST